MRAQPGIFGLTLDDGEPAGILRSIEGGDLGVDVVTMAVGGGPIKFKTAATPTFKPITVQVGLDMAESFWQWIGRSWEGEVERRNGAVVICDADAKIIRQLEFMNALPVQCDFPALVAQQSTEAAFVTVKLQPEEAKWTDGDGSEWRAPTPGTQKVWQTNNFFFSIDPPGMLACNRIEAFNVQQKVKAFNVGGEICPQWEPTGLEFSNISVTFPHDDSLEPLLKWHEDFVLKGKNSAAFERTGAIILADTSGAVELARVDLFGVGISNMVLNKVERKGNAVQTVKFDFYVERMKLSYGEVDLWSIL